MDGGRPSIQNLLTFLFQDYMLIDPFVNGFAELHDQHIDMMVDVDNMSYEVNPHNYDGCSHS